MTGGVACLFPVVGGEDAPACVRKCIHTGRLFYYRPALCRRYPIATSYNKD
jgi:hypothetical protein